MPLSNGSDENKMTYLCVAIFVRDAEQAKREITLAAEAGADLVELRVDRATIEQIEEFATAVRDSIVPALVTCRPTWEGGQSELDDAGRVTILAGAADAGASYIDVELKTVQANKDRFADVMGEVDEQQRPRVIVSSHDFTGRPDRLYNMLAEMNALPGHIDKLVWTARTVRDNLEAFEILLTRHKPMIALCMGEAGVISRILAKKFGAFLTFASLSNDSGTAPGQISVHDLKRLYRWDAINPSTKVYGVVAQPVMHSMSPAIHNAAFAHTGLDAVYVPLLVEGSYESFKAFMESFLAFEPLHLSGLSITLPHKENALRYLEEKGADIEPLAKTIGAVNTILIERTADGVPRHTLRGRNTDYAAILDSITDKLGITRERLAGISVAVIGAGGTGRTAVAALAHYGANVIVYNRTRQRAEALAKEFNGRSGQVLAKSLDELRGSSHRIYLNTTSVGMYPKVDASPVDDAPPNFSAQTLVFDTIYNPMQTKLLTQAAAAGAPTIGGVEMFVRQAAAQFQYWMGQPAPTDVMRRIVEQRLGQ